MNMHRFNRKRTVKWTILITLLVCIDAAICLAGAPAANPTKAEAIAKAKAYLVGQTGPGGILSADKVKDFLDPEKPHNSVAVSDDLTEVRFTHNDFAYDGPAITFTVKMTDSLSFRSIQIMITPSAFP
jgi:hypothetical protein